MWAIVNSEVLQIGRLGKMLALLPLFLLGGEDWILSHSDHSGFPSDKTEYSVAVTVTSNCSRSVCSMLFALKLVFMFVAVMKLDYVSCDRVKQSCHLPLR
jgi:hypothetical protein